MCIGDRWFFCTSGHRSWVLAYNLHLQIDRRILMDRLFGLRGAVTLHVHGGHVVSPMDIRKSGFGTGAVRWLLTGCEPGAVTLLSGRGTQVPRFFILHRACPVEDNPPKPRRRRMDAEEIGDNPGRGRSDG